VDSLLQRRRPVSLWLLRAGPGADEWQSILEDQGDVGLTALEDRACQVAEALQNRCFLGFPYALSFRGGL
jgi:hypothetical protein